MSMDTESLREIAVATVTSAVNARAAETIEERIEQYGDDFSILLEGMTHEDLFRLTSLLADMSGFLVGLIASSKDIAPEVAMQFIAQQMLAAGSVDSRDLDEE